MSKRAPAEQPRQPPGLEEQLERREGAGLVADPGREDLDPQRRGCAPAISPGGLSETTVGSQRERSSRRSSCQSASSEPPTPLEVMR